MELRQIKYFITVAEELHFGRAAEKLKMTQPPLSQQIQQLERELGVTLFKRTKRHVELTNAGRIFLQEVQGISTKLEHAKELAVRAQEGMAGRLAIGFVGSANFSILPQLIRGFQEQFPEVDLVLHEMPTPMQIEAFQNNKIDIGFVRPLASHNPSLTLLSVQQETCVAVVPMSHPLSQRSAISLKELEKEKFILVEREIWPSWYDDILIRCNQAGFTPMIQQSVKEIQTVVGLVASELGVSIVPKSTSHFHLSEVSYLNIKKESPRIEMSLAWRTDNDSILIKQFIETAAQIIDFELT